MNGDLERRYRRLLMLLPKDYRESRGEEMVGAYLDAAEGEGGHRTRPDVREVLSLTALAARTRLWLPSARRPATGPEVARLTALCGAFWLAVTGFGDAMTASGSPQGLDAAQWEFHWSQALWLGVYLVLAGGWSRLGGVLAVGTGCTEAASLAHLEWSAWPRVNWLPLLPFMAVTAVAAFVAARRPTPPRRGWFAAVLVPVAIGLYWFHEASMDFIPVGIPEIRDGWWPMVLVIALVVAVCWRNRRSAAWLPALAVAGLQPLLVAAVVPDVDPWFMPEVWLYAAFEACLLLAIAARMLRGRRRETNSTDNRAMLGGPA